MSAAAPALPTAGSQALWKSQLPTVLWMELRKNFISRRGFWIYLLAAAPPALAWLHSILTAQRPERLAHDLSRDTQALAVIFQMFFLRPAVYFGCVGIFNWLFRGEVVERSLHYYFLAPIRREVLVLAKYLAGAITASTFFGASILLTFFGMYGHFPGFEFGEFMSTSGTSHVISYTTITILACLAWGAVFTWMGIRWRNPIVPSVTFLLWESLNVFLPSWLRKISVLHYLQSMTPVQGDLRGPGLLLGRTTDPVAGWVAVLAVLAITTGALWLAVYELKRTEISYSSD
jgi:hypothetical protein